MLEMFDFLKDATNYDTRKIGRDDFAWGFISTARVSDGRKPYETAVLHDGYVRADGKKGEMCIAENYDTREEAEAGHAKWVAAMTGDALPPKLTDCCNSHVAEMLDAVSDGDNGLTWTLRA